MKEYNLYTDAFRFIGAGAINTIITLSIYQILLFWTTYDVAYAASWVSGLILVVVFYPSKVFNTKNANFKHRLLISIIYALNFIIGYLVLNAFSLSFPETKIIDRISIIFSISITTILNFFTIRQILK